jgi:hypothetical protein
VTGRWAPPPEVRITVFLPGSPPQDITLSYPLDPAHAELLRDLHEAGNERGRIECRMHDDDPKLRDLRSQDGRLHEAWLLLRHHPHRKGQFVLAHWPNSHVKGSHDVPPGMLAEHRAQQEYIAARGQASGSEVDLEKSLAPGSRCDVVVRGRVAVLAAEVQISPIATATVLRRTRLVTAAGATSTWFASLRNPPWAFKAPHVETNRRDGMAPRTWTVATGPRVLEWERCRPGSRLGRCAARRRNWCGAWHPLWTPMPGLTVDDVVERVPAGELVRLDTGTRQGSILTEPRFRDAWLNERGPDVRRTEGREHSAGPLRHADYSASALRERIGSDTEARVPLAVEALGAPAGSLPLGMPAEPPLHRPRRCPACGGESRAIVDSRCFACRWRSS